MACSEYHSPQFSEDPAWLPTWLHPYEQSNNKFQEQNHGNATPVKACHFVQENLWRGGNAELSTSSGTKYTSCNLYLSGDDTQQVDSASRSNAMHFSLHLSSTSISQVLPTHFNEIADLDKHEMNKGPFMKCVLESPAITHGLSYQYPCEDPTPRLDSSPAVFKQNKSNELNAEHPIKTNHSTEEECHGKLDGEGFKETVVEEAVELTIAASEALAISEMLFSSMHLESFSDAAILEIALRVKQARTECMSETHVLSAGDPDDNDKLSDLDEDSMLNAFADVGLNIHELVESSNFPLTCRKSYKNVCSSDTEQQDILKSDTLCGHEMLTVDFGVEREVLTDMIKGVNTCKSTSKICSPLDRKLQSKNMQLESRPRMQTNQTNASDNLPLDFSIPCFKDNSTYQEQKLYIIDALQEDLTCSMEHQCVQKVGKALQRSNAKVRNSMKLFKWETSFLSESMDALDQDTSQGKPSVQLEIVSSSDTVLQASSSSIRKEMKHNHEPPLSQDYSRSLSDHLCTIVPCSISSGAAANYEYKHAFDAVEKPRNPMTVNYSKCLDEDSIMHNKLMSPEPSVESGGFFHSETKLEQPGVPRRKQLNSLRSDSLVTDNHKMVEGRIFQCEKFPLYDKHVAVMDSSSKMLECSNKNDIDLPGNCFAGKSNNEQIHEKENIGVQSIAFGNNESNTRPPVLEDTCSHPILDCTNHPCESCEVTTGDDGNESIKVLSSLNFTKCRSNDSTKRACYRNETLDISCVPIQSCLHPFPEDKRLRKRVRFQESASSMGLRKTSSMHSKYQTRLSSGTAKLLQNYSLLYKPEFGWDQNITYLKSNGAVKNDSMILQGLDFLLTGFSSSKAKELEELIRTHGGYVLQNIPSFPLYSSGKSIITASRNLPVVLCPKKVQTTKYLYGCAVNAFLLNYRWLEDSVQFGTILPPGKYLTLSIPSVRGNKLIIGESLCLYDMPIFNKIGMMVHGRVKFCSKFMIIIKDVNARWVIATNARITKNHGGGQVFKSLQRLVQSLKNGANKLGIILVKNESCVSRHLKHCALEHGIPTMPASWIISSLFSGKLLPPKRDRCAALRRITTPSFPNPLFDEMSQEI